MKVPGIKAYVYFFDPFAGRNAMLESGDVDDARREGALSLFAGRRAAKPW